MDKTVIIKITISDGTVLEIESPTDAANTISQQITMTGYLDPVNGHFYPSEAVAQIEIAVSEKFGGG